MKGLAWDDEPDFLKGLVPHLEKRKIFLEVTDDDELFLSRIGDPNEHWDFAISDLFKPAPIEGQPDHPFGAIFAARHHVTLPVFIVTKNMAKAEVEAIHDLPSDVRLLSKATPRAYMADDIHKELVRRGIYVDYDKVFVVYGRTAKSNGELNRLIAHLEDLGLNPVVIDEDIRTAVINGLVERMNDCAAVVALLTPDDEVAEKDNHYWQPRPNVFIELGMAVMLGRGLERLVLIQKCGPKNRPEQHAHLPKDLDGIIPIRYEGEIDSAFAQIEQSLSDRELLHRS